MAVRCVVSAAFLVGLAGCEPIPGSGAQKIEFTTQDESFEEFLTPHYGNERTISGEFFLHWETSTINLCDDRENCKLRRNVDDSEQLCWVEFAEGPSSNKYLSGAKEGAYWLSGTGKIAVLPGSFGHLGGYTCQVEITKIDKFEPVRGYYEPPPPGEK